MEYKLNSHGYSASSDTEYRLLGLESQLPIMEDSSAANSTIFANLPGPSDRFEDLGFEGDTDTDIDTKGDEDKGQQNSPEKKDENGKDADPKSVKDNYKNFIDNPNVVNGVKTAQALAHKASDFTKSSFAQINKIPEKRREAASAKMIAAAADKPTTLGSQVKSFAMKAGKGAGFVALSVACLPAAAAALVANKHIKQQDKKRAAEDLQRQILVIDEKLKDSDNDADSKADLLIAKRQAEAALNKIKYGLDLRGV